MAASRAVLAFLWLAACSHDWDAFDPRLGTTGGDGGGGASPTTTTSSTAAMTASSTGATSSSTSTNGTSSAGGGGAGPGQITYTAVVADCINPTAPDPDACEAEAGQGIMTVDTQFDPVTDPTARNAYLRFDLDDTLAGKTIDAATVQLRVRMESGSESNQTGHLWEVEPFTRAELSMMTPGPVGAAPLVPDQGNVAAGEQVTFTIPATLLDPGGSVYVGLLPLTTNGVDYHNLNGTDPPLLVVDYH